MAPKHLPPLKVNGIREVFSPQTRPHMYSKHSFSFLLSNVAPKYAPICRLRDTKLIAVFRFIWFTVR